MEGHEEWGPGPDPADYFPYPSFRRYQRDVIRFAYDVLARGRIGLINAPCGIGKSIAVLTAYLMARDTVLSGEEAKLMVLTRTKAQLEIYVREVRHVRERLGLELKAAVFASRKDMCPLRLDSPSLARARYKDFLRMCRELRRGRRAVCPYYEATYRTRLRPSYATKTAVDRALRLGAALPSEVLEIGRDLGVCSYEVVKCMARRAELLVGNYNYLLLEPVREAVLWRFGADLPELNCVVDEAHNLDKWAVEVMSDDISSVSFRRAVKEAEEYEVHDRGLMDFMADYVDELGEETYKLYGPDYERLVDPELVAEDVLSRLGLTSKRVLISLLRFLEGEGDKIRLARAEEGESPISYVGRCASFLLDFLTYGGREFAHYSLATERDGEVRGRLGLRCLDPSMTASILNELRSVVLMSGTLWEPGYYVEVLGLDSSRTCFLSVPSPFPRSNRLLLVDKAVSTKYERRVEAEFDAIARRLSALIKAIGGRVAVYFPSYDVMEEVLKRLELDVPSLVEDRRTKIDEVLSFLSSHVECVLFGVARGKVSEGVDLSAGGKGLLSGVVIVGLPYPRKTGLQEALTAYFREKFGRRGWHYANRVPCLVALAQSAGRLQRSEADRGVVVIMDKRAAGYFKRYLPGDWRADMKASANLEVLVGSIEEFMGRRASRHASPSRAGGP